MFSVVSFELLLEPNSAPRNGKVGAARSALALVGLGVLRVNIE